MKIQAPNPKPGHDFDNKKLIEETLDGGVIVACENVDKDDPMFFVTGNRYHQTVELYLQGGVFIMAVEMKNVMLVRRQCQKIEK